jgi:hypothetical protein
MKLKTPIPTNIKKPINNIQDINYEKLIEDITNTDTYLHPNVLIIIHTNERYSRQQIEQISKIVQQLNPTWHANQIKKWQENGQPDIARQV